MEPWAIFWLAVLLIMVWTFRNWIAIGILAVIAFIAGILGLGTFKAFEAFGHFSDWRHEKKLTDLKRAAKKARQRRSGGK